MVLVVTWSRVICRRGRSAYTRAVLATGRNADASSFHSAGFRFWNDHSTPAASGSILVIEKHTFMDSR